MTFVFGLGVGVAAGVAVGAAVGAAATVGAVVAVGAADGFTTVGVGVGLAWQAKAVSRRTVAAKDRSARYNDVFLLVDIIIIILLEYRNQ